MPAPPSTSAKATAHFPTADLPCGGCECSLVVRSIDWFGCEPEWLPGRPNGMDVVEVMAGMVPVLLYDPKSGNRSFNQTTTSRLLEA